MLVYWKFFDDLRSYLARTIMKKGGYIWAKQ